MRGLGLALGLSLLAPAVVAGHQEKAEDAEDATGWRATAELSYVATGGNAEAETLSLRNTLVRGWEGALLTIEAAALRAKNTTRDPVAMGDPTSFTIDENERSELTAESYLLRGRYEGALSKSRYWFAGARWERNEFAGVADRVVVTGGFGRTWLDGENGHFKTDYALSVTEQEDLAGGSEHFAGLRLGWDYRRRLSPTTVYTNRWIVDLNAEETSDYRGDMINSVAVKINDRLALKVSLQLLYDHLPSLVEVPLVGIDGKPTGNTALVPLDELDSVFNVALVVNF